MATKSYLKQTRGWEIHTTEKENIQNRNNFGKTIGRNKGPSRRQSQNASPRKENRMIPTSELHFHTNRKQLSIQKGNSNNAKIQNIAQTGHANYCRNGQMRKNAQLINYAVKSPVWHQYSKKHGKSRNLISHTRTTPTFAQDCAILGKCIGAETSLGDCDGFARIKSSHASRRTQFHSITEKGNVEFTP